MKDWVVTAVAMTLALLSASVTVALMFVATNVSFGAAIVLLWRWFVVPLGAPQLPFWNAVGAAAILELVSHDRHLDLKVMKFKGILTTPAHPSATIGHLLLNGTREEFEMRHVVAALVRPWMFVLFGWVLLQAQRWLG